MSSGAKTRTGDEAGVLWTWISRIGAQTALLTAMFFYFGWARTNATYRFFGLDVSLLKYSTSDYLLRSANAAYKPLLMIGLVAVTAALVANLLGFVRRQGAMGAIRVTQRAAIVVGVVAMVAGLIALIAGAGQLAGALPLVVGATILRWAVAIEDAPLTEPRRAGTAAGLNIRNALTGLVVITGFWALASYADRVGQAQAKRLLGDRSLTSSVVLFSREPLGIRGPGVKVAPAPVGSAPYRWRITGLRLLAHSGGRLFLLPDGWKRGRDALLVISDGVGTRIELKTS